MERLACACQAGRLKLAGLVAFVLLLVAACAIEAQITEPPPRSIVARISALRGQVGVTPLGAAAPHQADSRPLAGGERIETDLDGRALLRLGSTAVRIGPRADLILGTLDEQRTVIELVAGSIALKITAPEWAARIEVAVPEGRWRALRPGHYRFDRWGDASRATVWDGEARFDSPATTLRLDAGRRVELAYAPGRPAIEATWGEPVADELAEWVKRDARIEADAAALRHVSPEMPGWEDLDAHGDWTLHPEWGSVWIPRGVGSDWTPFAAGRWTWSPPWGWIWVDDSRWGFAPSHYGHWNQWRGRWVWVPGPRHEPPRFRPAPPQAGPPPRQRPPAPVPLPAPLPHAPPGSAPVTPVAPAPHGPRPPAPWIRSTPAVPPVATPPRPAPEPDRPRPAPRPPAPATPTAPPAPSVAPVPPVPPAPAAPSPAPPAPPGHRGPAPQPPVAAPTAPPPHGAAPPVNPPAPATPAPRPAERRRPGAPAEGAPAEAPPKTIDGGGPRGRTPQAAP